MQEMIHERRTVGKKEDRYDLFSQLLDANEEPGMYGNAMLTDDELFGPPAFLPLPPV
jgi:hypothetical protein